MVEHLNLCRIATSLIAAASAMVVFATNVPAQSECWTYETDLPVRRTNNAVTYYEHEGRGYLLSCLGLDETKVYSGVQRDAWRYDIAAKTWQQLPDVPGDVGRVAAAASTLRGKVYVIGGYSIAQNGAEVSFDNVDIFDPATGEWSAGPPLPFPIDDHVQVVRDDRWIYTVSGWSNTRTRNYVQVFDAETGEWAQATPTRSGAFGHAGGISNGDTLWYVDGALGVGAFPLFERFDIGTIDPTDPLVVTWGAAGMDGEYDADPGYRMGGIGFGDHLVLIGGADNSYNYDGIGYDNVPAQPHERLIVVAADGTLVETPCAEGPPTPIMDIRNIATTGTTAAGHHKYWLVGGMTTGQSVTNKVQRLDAEAITGAPGAIVIR